ncbi:MAG: hypothetical protein ACTSRI_13765 [Promethearchaeota archaeon]
MPYIDKAEVEILAYRRYKTNESYSKSVWYLAELCVTINKNIKNADQIRPLESDNVVLLLKDNVDGEVISPTKEEITELAEIIYHEGPEKSKLHFHIAEKALLLEEIKKVIRENT